MVDLFPFNLAGSEVMLKPVLLIVASLLLAACAASPERAAAPGVPQGLGVTALSSELARVATLTPEQRRRELALLDAERRLDDARRFQQAALLEREENAEALERGLKSLGALGELDPRARPLVELMKRSLRARLELRQQAAQTQALQEKLDQIKALENSLQQHATPEKP